MLLLSNILLAQLPTTNLSGYYEFTNGAMSDGANGNNFVQTGTALALETDRFSVVNNAINLNGDYLTANNFNFGSEIALSFWVKTATNDVDSKVIFEQKDNVGFNIYLQDGKIGVSGRSQYYDLGTSFQDWDFNNLFSTVISDNIWHHVVVNIKYVKTSGTKFDFYIDVYTDTIKESVVVGRNYYRMQDSGGVNKNTPFKVANNKNNSLAATAMYGDVLDDLLFYSQILTDAEVTQLAELNGYGFCFAPDIANLTVSNITENSADIAWTDAGTYDIAYGLKNEPFSNYTMVTDVTTGNLSLASLSSSNYYNVYYRTKCTSTYAPASSWSLAKEFRTNGRYYVKADATGFNDGSSWADAYTNLQDALTNLIDDDIVWVAKGTYIPDASDNSITFEINKTNISLYGGFSGTENVLEDRVLSLVNTTNETILSGDLLNNDDTNITFSNTTRSDNSLIVVRINGYNATIDGFTITGGNSTTKGAGILYSRVNITRGLNIKHAVIKNNISGEGAGLYYEAYYNTDALVIDKCVFENNLAKGGAALSYLKDGRYAYSVTISNSLFKGNTSKNQGTGNNGSAASAGWFRGVKYGNTTTAVKLVNNTYVNNSDLGTSTGLNNFNRATIGVTREEVQGHINVEMSNCIFWNNTTVNGVISKAVSGLNSTLNYVNIFNSIDQDNFSLVSSSDKTNTSNSDPLFTDLANGDFTLASGSPAIDSGDNSKIPAGITTDILGLNRVFNTTVDMGVYEFGSTLSTNDLGFSENDIKLYPNPTTSVLNVKMGTVFKQASIYSVLGAKVLETSLPIINTSALKSGMYLIEIQDENGKVSTKRFIKN